ncbi:MAG TPA: hypothetical protein VEX39_18430 [Thermoleophilaceae bacterium]|nr:hypothetical protein [Thermoleophilaceae bacterium]
MSLAEVDERFYRSHGSGGGTDAKFAGEDHNASGLWDWEEQALERFFAPGSRVVVTAAGGGREVLALAQRGYRVAGYEPNDSLVQAGRRLLSARELPVTASLDGCPRDRFPAGAPECEGVVVGWGSYIHIQGRAARVSLLEQARARLSPGDPVLVSFWLRPPGQRYLSVVRRLATPLRAARGLPPPELGDTVRDTFVHWFTRAEIESELREAGFEPAHFAAEPYAHAVGVVASDRR